MKPLVVAATSIKLKSAFLHEFNIYCLQCSKFVHSRHKGCLSEVFDNMFQYASNIYCYNTRYTAKKNLYKMSVQTNIGKQSISFIATDIWKDLPTYLNNSSRYMSAFPKKFIHYLLSEQQMKYATCVSSRFWLGTQRDKGMQGQRNIAEIGAGAMRNCLYGWVAFLSSPNACIRIVPFESECSPANQIFGNLLWESSNWLNKSSPQNKIKISKKRWQEHCQSWIFKEKKAWTGNGPRRGVLLGILVGGVPPSSPNADPVSDQKI